MLDNLQHAFPNPINWLTQTNSITVTNISLITASTSVYEQQQQKETPQLVAQQTAIEVSLRELKRQVQELCNAKGSVHLAKIVTPSEKGKKWLKRERNERIEMITEEREYHDYQCERRILRQDKRRLSYFLHLLYFLPLTLISTSCSYFPHSLLFSITLNQNNLAFSTLY